MLFPEYHKGVVPKKWGEFVYINNNFIGMNAHRNWTMHHNKMAKALERLSSGNRINRAADDPAGMAISEKLKFQLTMLKTDKSNAMDAMSKLQISDGVLGEMNSMLGRMQELADLAANGIYSEVERHNMDAEYQQLLSEINRGRESVVYDSKKLFASSGLKNVSGKAADSDPSANISFQGNNLKAYLDGLDQLLSDISLAAGQGDDDALLALGIDRANGKTDCENLHSAVIEYTKENAARLLNTPGNSDGSGSDFTIDLSDGEIIIHMPVINQDTLGLGGSNLLTQDAARKAMDQVKNASKSVSSWRGDTGAAYNRLEHTINSISTMEENLTAALSRITDTDLAKEMMIFVKEKAMAQASMFVMAQANQQPQQVLSLIKSLG